MNLSVFVVTYNRAEYLKETIYSILNQTFKDFSLIILDNCSNDNTNEVVASINDNRIQYVRHSTNIGGIGNINYAIDHCESEYMVIFHDDDLMLSTFLEKEISILKERSDIVAVAGNAVYFGAVSRGTIKSNRNRKNSNLKIYEKNELLIRYLNDGNYLVFPSLMYRTSFLKKHDLRIRPEPGPCSDIVFYFDICQKGGKIAELSEVIMKYRTHSNQDSEVNKYPMHIKLFNFLKCDDTFSQCYQQNDIGRKKRYAYFSKKLMLDWLHNKVTTKDASLFYINLSDELCVKNQNIWYYLFKMCNSKNRLKKIMFICDKIRFAVKYGR